MAGFRFRAQAALDLRRRALEAAERALAQAGADRELARRRLDDAHAALARAQTAAATDMRRPGLPTAHAWYRSWIVRLEQEQGTAARVLAAHDMRLERTRAACLHARQQYESLERFRERAEAAFDAAVTEQERKHNDELATQRFMAARETRQGAAS